MRVVNVRTTSSPGVLQQVVRWLETLKFHLKCFSKIEDRRISKLAAFGNYDKRLSNRGAGEGHSLHPQTTSINKTKMIQAAKILEQRSHLVPGKNIYVAV